METIYVVGHRNPDTDSIVSAMAYAALRNALGDRTYTPARLGHISDETQSVLERFGFEPPVLIHNLRTQVRDLDYDTPPALSSAVPVNRAWGVLQDVAIPAIPVVDDRGHIFGMLTPGDIAAYDMRSIEHPVLENVPLFNLLSVLEGHDLNEGINLSDSVSGEVIIAMPKAHDAPIFTNTDCILLCGQQPEVMRAAIEAGVRTLICQVCNGSPYAYFEQDGDDFVCQNCHNRFSPTDIGMVSGGCDPVPITAEIYREEDGALVIPLSFLEENAARFANWKKF